MHYNVPMGIKCSTCGIQIPEARLKIVPDAKYCVTCQEKHDKPIRGYMSWEHKTAPTLVLGKDAEKLHLYAREGFHAQLPMQSKEKAEEELSESVSEIPPAKPTHDIVSEKPFFFVPSKCHPEKPKATTDGKCVDCALAWYRRRK